MYGRLSINRVNTPVHNAVFQINVLVEISDKIRNIVYIYYVKEGSPRKDPIVHFSTQKAPIAYLVGFIILHH